MAKNFPLMIHPQHLKEIMADPSAGGVIDILKHAGALVKTVSSGEEVPTDGSWSYLAQVGVPPPESISLSNIQSPTVTEPTVSVLKTEFYKSGGVAKKKTFWSDGSVTIETAGAESGISPDEPPRPRRAFPDEMSDRSLWAYVVERRTLNHLMDKEWWGDWKGAGSQFFPIGFPTRADALRRTLDCMKQDAHNISLGVAEFQVTAKYIGHKPDAESWYASCYPPQQPESTR